MKFNIPLAAVTGLFWAATVAGQEPRPLNLADNAALRYWSAFAQMQDTTVTPEQAKEMQAILQGAAPYSDLKHRELLERNRGAIETLRRGGLLRQCDWGIEYQLGSQAPVEYVRKGLALGRLNILYAFHQLQIGGRADGINGLIMGIRFSSHLGEGGSLFATLAAKNLMMAHLRGFDFAAASRPLSNAEKKLVLDSLAGLGDEGVDWQAAINREFELLQRSGAPVPSTLAHLYRSALRDNARLPQCEQAIAAAPKAVSAHIPNPKRVIEQRAELLEKLRQTRQALLK